MANESNLRRVALFALRLICIAPAALAAWWWTMPAYAWILGHTAALVLKCGGFPIRGVIVHANGFLNTDTTLGFDLGGRTPTMPVSWVITNVAVYVSLVLATRRVTWRKRARAIGIGAAILAGTHITHIVVFFVFAKAIALHPQVPTAIGQIFVTLPFLLWIVLVYWQPDPAPSTNPAPPSSSETTT